MHKKIKVGFQGMDQVEVSFQETGDHIEILQIEAVGTLELLQALKNWKQSFPVNKSNLKSPSGKTPHELLLKELTLRLGEQWPLQNDEDELCHCRKTPQSSVERAVVLGARTVEQIRARTSANTGCGTCLPDVERVLAAYLL